MSSGIAVTPSFVTDLESRMRIITSNSYDSMLDSLWYQHVTRVVPTASRREIMHFLLDSATIDYTQEGNVEFEELSFQRTEYEASYASKGLKVLKSKFEDLDGNGVNTATAWARQIGAYASYFPQEQVAKLIIGGTSVVGYDGVSFFSTSHPLDPFNDSAGVYSNLLTTGVRLDDRHSIETAYTSLNAIKKAVASIKMPNGKTPRNLRIKGFLAPTAMVQRLNTLLGAKFIGGTAGSTDVSGVISSMGFPAGVIEAQELGAAYGGSDTDCYLITDEIGSQDLDALVFVEREPFAIQFYSGQDGGAMSADLGRARELEWHVHGRNAAGTGHPFKLIKLVGQAP